MHPNRRRKKRPSYGLRTVEVVRGANGFGFTISGQQPCILSCIVNNSPADQAGLRAGDFLISVNGVSVSKMAHDAVVNLIGNCPDPIKMTIAENYYSDSSDEELECGRVAGSRKPKYMHKPRLNRRIYKGIVMEPNEKNVAKLRDNIIKPRLNNNLFEDKSDHEDREKCDVNNGIEGEAGPVEFKVLVSYLGTIEMPKQLLPNSRFQIVSSCIRKLRQEKRSPTAVLMTVLPTCLTLKNAANHIIAIYPANRVVYIGTPTDKDCRYFGLVTSAVCDNRSHTDVDISNSCHVFVIDPKIADHRVHLERAETFKILCTPDPITGLCLEFPQNALYIVNLIQTMYKLAGDPCNKNDLNIPIVANSPQPSASSNSDSGIGYRDDCGNISDRILVVEFPAHRPLPVVTNNNRPQGIDGGDLALEAFEFPLDHNFEMNNKYKLNNLAISDVNGDFKTSSNLNNIRAYDNIKNHFDNPTGLLQKQNNTSFKESNRLTCRAIIPSVPCLGIKYSDVDTGQTYSEHPVDVVEVLTSQNIENGDFKRSVDNVSVQSSKSGDLGNLMNIFRIPFDGKRGKKQTKGVSSCENLDKCPKSYHKLSPKVYGVAKANHSCEELNNVELYEDKLCYGSLQELSSWYGQGQPRRNIAQSEPDVRIHRSNENECDQHGVGGVNRIGTDGKRGPDGPVSWATSFEKLLEDVVGLHAFAEFLKKEFSAENIYFWTACERYKNLTSGAERASKAELIFKQHLGSGAAEAVNVDAQGLQAAEQGLAEGRLDLFDTAQKQIFNLMKFDSYPRFLKSQLYKKCLSGDFYLPNFDVRLSVQTGVPSASTPSKLKKSLSNAEDRRRKSLLPWSRKNANQRSKSRDRNELASTQKSWDGVLTVPCGEDGRRFLSATADVHSSHSSLTSLDLASTQDTLKPETSGDGRTSLCRVLLSNGSTTVVQIKDGESIQQLVNRLLEKRGLTYSSFEVSTNKHSKPLDIAESSTQLAGCEVTVEQRVVFKLDLPNRKIISVKSKYTKNIVDVLRPILHKYKFNLEEVIVTRSGYTVDVNLSVVTIDNARLNIQLKDGCDGCDSNTNPTKSNVKISKLEEITNKVFEGILQEKSDEGVFKPPRSDKGSVKSEDWGSEHSSGLMKFLRRDSAVHEKKKKTVCHRGKAVGDSEEVGGEGYHKKPLIAKLKAGANKLHVGTYSESDELVEGLTRAQRRLEDQRGTEINFELPDFLKDKDEDHSSRHHAPSFSATECKTSFTKPLKPETCSTYENQNVSGQTMKSAITTPETSPVNNTEVEQAAGPKTDPPPLPPKPKIVPIKPPNWGHSGFYKAKEVPLGKHPEMFLEQSSSSFV